MNRRSFFTKLGLAAASMAILPAATTYARHWVKPANGIIITPVLELIMDPRALNLELYNFQYTWYPITKEYLKQQREYLKNSPIPQPKFSNFDTATLIEV